MKKVKLAFRQGLSVQELEKRHELSIVLPGDITDAAKDDNNESTIGRCSDNEG